MKEINLQKEGFKAGLEIHQQLDTHKLFCNCPSIIREDKPDFEIKRKLRALAGESGKIDIAAKQEQEKEMTFIYQGYQDTNCLVELDDEPPHEVNKEALEIVLQFCKIVNANIIKKVQVMRKIVVDGSNTSGFQRTMLIATGGKIKTKQGPVRIQTICLEEDACKIIKKEHNQRTYRLDRLGIPLIEVATEPDITSPEQLKETAEQIGLILRSLKVKRGLGTIRQDVNISIKKGTRIELKGVQNLKDIPGLGKNEALRQKNLIEIQKEIKTRKAKPNEKLIDITNLMKKSESKIIKKSLETKGAKVLGIKLENFSGILGKELMPNYRFATELSDYAKIKAGTRGLFHSDELPNYGITEKEVQKIKEELKCKKEDAFIILADEENKTKRALKYIIERTNELSKKIPGEVRNAQAEISRYLRPMPGAERMYPETDIPIIEIKDNKIEIPELIYQKIERYKKLGLGKDLAKLIAKNTQKSNLFDEITQKNKTIKPAFIAEIILPKIKEIERKNPKTNTTKITNNDFKEIFEKLEKKEITKASIEEILTKIAQGKKINYKEYKPLTQKEIEKEIQQIVKQNSDKNKGALIGIIMGKLRSKANPQEIMNLIKEVIKK